MVKQGLDFDAFFMRRFPKFKELEAELRKKDEALDLSAAAIRAYRHEVAALQKKADSNSDLIKSLNRYIGMLEGRDEERLRRIDELERACEESMNYINRTVGTPFRHNTGEGGTAAMTNKQPRP